MFSGDSSIIRRYKITYKILIHEAKPNHRITSNRHFKESSERSVEKSELLRKYQCWSVLVPSLKFGSS